MGCVVTNFRGTGGSAASQHLLCSTSKSNSFSNGRLQVSSASKINTELARTKLECPRFLRKLAELRPPTDKETVSLDSLLQSYFQEKPSGYESSAPHHAFYEIALTYHNYAVEFLWLVPCNYPENRSKIKLLHYYNTKAKDATHLTQEKVLLRLPQPQGVAQPTVSGECAERRPSDMIRMELIQDEVNGDLAELGAQQHPNFYLLYQLNRLFTVLEESHQKQEGEQQLHRYPQ